MDCGIRSASYDKTENPVPAKEKENRTFMSEFQWMFRGDSSIDMRSWRDRTTEGS